MLNPKLIEVYGEESRDLLNKLVDEIGESNAETCYVVANSFKRINGVDMPGSIRTISDKIDIRWGIHTFIDKYTKAEDESWIFVFDKEVPKEGDIQLWLSSDIKTD